MTTRLAGLTGATLPQVAPVCHECVWWQSRTGGRRVDKARWIEKAETEFGAWGTVYYDDDRRVLGSMQYGAARLFPLADDLPAGPPSDDAVLVTCAYLLDRSSPWVLQSLFLAAIADAKDKGAAALETFPGLLAADEEALTGPLALLYRHLDADDLEDADALLAEIEMLEPPEDLAAAVEEVVRATLLLADVGADVGKR